MTHYELTQLATRKCEHGRNTVCMCPRKTGISPAVQAYLDKAKRRLRESILYNPEWKPEGQYQFGNKRFRWIEHPDRGLRFVGDVHEIRGSGDGNIPYFDRAIGNARPLAERYLKEYGAWDDLSTCDVSTLAQRILWTACCDIREQGEWLGLVH